MTSTFPDISINTERLVLRAFEEEDVSPLAELWADEPASTWLSDPIPAGEEQTRDWALRHCREQLETGRGVSFAAVEFMTNRLVGFIEVKNTDWRSRTAELTCAVGPWARGEGYAPEAVLAVAQWLFEDQKFERVELRTGSGNTSAQQVAQKVGCISEGVLRSAALIRTGAAVPVGGAPAPAGVGGGEETRTDVIVWSLLPEDLDGMHEAQAADGLPRAQFGMWD
jgi:RimJ/RimL family protein N-acetyltransferase